MYYFSIVPDNQSCTQLCYLHVSRRQLCFTLGSFKHSSSFFILRLVTIGTRICSVANREHLIHFLRTQWLHLPCHQPVHHRQEPPQKLPGLPTPEVLWSWNDEMWWDAVSFVLTTPFLHPHNYQILNERLLSAECPKSLT